MSSTLVDASFCVVGLGLMGGSLAAALSRAGCNRVVGVARRQETLARALELGYISEGTLDLAEGVRQADIVILATPVRDIIIKIEHLGGMLKPEALVLDLGSTKVQICSALDHLPPQIQAVGGHPMCGKDSSGLEEADPELYRDKVFVLCPLERTTAASLDLCNLLLSSIGARPLLLSAERNDELAAAVSHVPYLAAVGLVNAAAELAGVDDLVWRVAASGFRDTTRLAASDVTMMLDILLTNRQAVLEALSHTQAQLSALQLSLEQEDQEALAALLLTARAQRKELYL